MMRLTVKLFGPQAAAVQRDAVEVELEDETATCEDLRRALTRVCPAVADTLAASRFAVNCELVDDAHPVDARDEIALIGMVSGG
jgi:molybdopterin converting factor small subunit